MNVGWIKRIHYNIRFLIAFQIFHGNCIVCLSSIVNQIVILTILNEFSIFCFFRWIDFVLSPIMFFLFWNKLDFIKANWEHNICQKKQKTKYFYGNSSASNQSNLVCGHFRRGMTIVSGMFGFNQLYHKYIELAFQIFLSSLFNCCLSYNCAP